MTQEFHISVTPIGNDEYLVRTERVAPGVPLAEEQVRWPVNDWLERASLLMNDPLTGLLRGDAIPSFPESLQETFNNGSNPASQRAINLISLGQHLYNALFQGTIRDSWMTAQGIAQHRQEILRLRLGLKDHRLPRLPWEVLHAGDRPLATGTDVLFSRYNSSFSAISSFQFQPVPVVEPGQALKILLVLAAPSDQEVLALKQEALHLQEELQDLQNGGRNGRFPDIQLTILEQPGREQLTQALEHNHYQVLHYAGHSNLGSDGGKLYLVSNKTGLTESVSGDDLAGLLVNNGIRMAVFNSCRGAYTATAESSAAVGEGNLAEALVKRGIPAVLAMAERIPDDVALNLSRLFYRNLKQLYPIDLSLSRARQGLLSSYGSDQMYWALPILYLQPEFNGYLQPPLEGTDNLLSIASVGETAEEPGLTEYAWNEDSPSLAASDDNESALLDEEALPDAEAFDAEEFDAEAFDAEEFDAGEWSEALSEDELDKEHLNKLYLDKENSSEDFAFKKGSAPGLSLTRLATEAFETEVLDRTFEPEDFKSEDFESEDFESEGFESGELDPFDDDSLPDPDDLEFDDPESQPELEIAQLVQQLSQSSFRTTGQDQALPAPPSEPLLPLEERTLRAADAPVSPDLPHVSHDAAPKVTSNPRRIAATVETEAPTLIEQADDGSVYLELERLWAETGKPTEAIAICNRAIQANPTDSEAYDRLGLTLYGQGYLSEAIAAYQQALRINPSLAEAHNHLGLALYQQGNVREAIRAYSRAIQLNPMLKEARQNLDVALRKQGVRLSPEQLHLDSEPVEFCSPMIESRPPGVEPDSRSGGNSTSVEMALPMPSPAMPFQQMLDFPRTSYARARAASLGQSTRSLLWAGAGAVSITAIVMGIWFSRHYIDSSWFRLPLFQSPVTKVGDGNEQTESTATVVELATRQLNRGDILGAEASIQTLLDRGALAQAVAAMTPVLQAKPDNPTLNYWMGRAVWQYAMTGNPDYSIEDARRYWEASNRREPTPQRQNALGFAYYAAGDLDRARHAWLRALELDGEGSARQSGAKPSNARSSYEALTARAGVALVLIKQAENQPPEERNRNRNQAAQLRQKILTDDPDRFQPEALSKNWMWPDQAVEDWKTLLNLK